MPDMQTSSTSTSSIAILQYNSHRSPQLKKQPYALNGLRYEPTHHQQNGITNGITGHRQKPFSGTKSSASSTRFNNENQRKMEALNYWKKAFQQPNTGFHNSSNNILPSKTSSSSSTNTISNARYIRYATATKSNNAIQQPLPFPTNEEYNTTIVEDDAATKKSQFLKTLSPIQNTPQFILANNGRNNINNREGNFVEKQQQQEDNSKIWSNYSNKTTLFSDGNTINKLFQQYYTPENEQTSNINHNNNNNNNGSHNCINDDDDSLIFSIEL